MKDVVVLGAGPAGLALASELSAGGADVMCVAPRPRRRWAQNYGVWLDELGSLHAAACVRDVWRQPRVRLDSARSFSLDRAYGRFDNDTLQDHLLGELERTGGTAHDATASSVEVRAATSRIHLDEGSPIDTRTVVDATGWASAFVSRPTRRWAYQSAYGELVRVARHPYAPSEMTFMDFSFHDEQDPTFLYALPMSDTLLFVEETSLVRRQPLSVMELRTRLHERLAHMGVSPTEVLQREHCIIPMGIGVPDVQRTIAFGAAAAFVHPASGYQLARALRLAKPTAAAILEHLDDGPNAASEAAYRTMWPTAARRSWELYRFGMDVLCGMDTQGIRRFMDAFFELPMDRSISYLAGQDSPARIANTMTRMLCAAQSDTRWSLLRAAAGRDAATLWRALMPGGAR